jgi:hypothetical protein
MKLLTYCSMGLLALVLGSGIWAWNTQRGAVAGNGPGTALGKKPVETPPALARTSSFSKSSVVISLHSGGELLITDSFGRRTGFNPTDEQMLSEIPHATYSNDSIDDADDDSGDAASTDQKSLDLRPPQPGIYILTVYGTRAGAYDLELFAASDKNKQQRMVLPSVPSTPGSRQSYSVVIPSNGGPVEIFGAFPGSHQSTEATHLLTYASPTTANSTLPPGTSSFPFIVFYGAQVVPSTFSATLNGKEITTSFHPGAKPFDVVSLNLYPGRNVLKLDVAGSVGPPVQDQFVFAIAQ